MARVVHDGRSMARVGHDGADNVLAVLQIASGSFRDLRFAKTRIGGG
jgi:hypothetical protein